MESSGVSGPIEESRRRGTGLSELQFGKGVELPVRKPFEVTCPENIPKTFLSVSEGNGESKGDERENESNQDFHSEMSLSVCGDWRNLTGGGA